MNEREKVALGEFCETLMRHDLFNVVCGVFRQSIFEQMMSTAPHETKNRESLYAQTWGVHSLLALMKQFVDEKNKLLGLEPSEDEQDTE